MSLENPVPLEGESYTSVTIQWFGSKNTVSRFTIAAFNFLANQDPTFFSRTETTSTQAASLFHTLGHNGRGMQDFTSVSMSFPLVKEGTLNTDTGHPNLISTMPLSLFYEQLLPQVEGYIVNVYRQRTSGIQKPRPDAWQKELNTLLILANQLRSDLITVRLDSFSETAYEIRGMVGPGYSYTEAI